MLSSRGAVVAACVAALAVAVASWVLRPVPGPDRARAGYVHDPPYMYRGTDGSPRGLSVDVLREAARRAGVTLDWVYVEQAGSVDRALEFGDVDVWPALTILPSRQEKFAFTDEWLQTEVWVVTRNGADLPGRDYTGPIGVAPLPITQWVVGQHFPKARMVDYADGAALATAICTAAVPVALLSAGDLATAQSTPQSPCQSATLRAHVLPESTLRIAVAARHGFAGTAERLRRQIDTMGSDGSIQTIVLPYSFYAASEVLAVYHVLQSRHRTRALAFATTALGVLLIATIVIFTVRRRADRAAREALLQRVALEEQLRVAQRLELIGQLAGGIAHDFNNLATVIVGHAELARAEAQGQPGVLASIDEIRCAGDRATELVRQLLGVGRRSPGEARIMPLHDGLSEVEPMLRRLLRADITLRIEKAAAHDRLHIDPSQLSRVLINLAVNARDAMPSGGALVIATANPPAPADRPIVRLSFEDTGIGMPPEVLARAFEPLFTTKPGKGTGLGLSSVRNIVEQSGGEIRVRSEAGRGTRFEIDWPAAEVAAAAEAAPAPAPPIVPAEHAILVVEDQQDVRDLVARVLRTRGYRVLVAGDGRVGLDLLREHHATVDLVVTDVVMPGLSGGRMVSEARATYGPMRALFISGYADDTVLAEVPEGDPLLQKPFRPNDLLAAVAAALSDGRDGSPSRPS